MIIKFEDYIKEDVMFTDNIKLNTRIFPIIRFDVYYGIINELDLNKLSIPYNYEIKKSVFWSQMFSNDIENDIMLNKCKYFFNIEILPYFRSLKIGIKNVIPNKFSVVDGYYRLDFDLRINKDFISNILNRISTNDERYNEEKMNSALFSVQNPLMNKNRLILNLKEIINGNKTINKTSIIPAYLNYEIEYDNMNFIEKFNQYILEDETLKDPNTYIKKN